MSLKNPPPESWEYIHKLHEKPSILARITGRQDPRLGYLHSLDQFKENGLIKYIFFLIFDDNDDVAFEAGKMIGERLSGIDVRELIDLDLDMRTYSEYSYCSLWGYRPKDLNKLKRFSDPVPLLGFCTFFPSGYVREEALHKLLQFRTGAELKFLLLRLNDWVPQIRNIAKKEVLSRINPKFISFFVDQFDLVERIYSWNRGNHSEVLQAIEETIIDPDSQEELFRALRHQNFRVRRLAVRIAAQRKAVPPFDLFNTISSDPDPMVRFLYVLSAKPHLDTDQLLQLTEALKNDSFMGIRKEILRLSVDNNLNNCSDMLFHAISDSHASIRDLARWYLKKQGLSQSYFQEHYRSLLIESPSKIGVILGIGEVGEENDAHRILPFLNHQRAKLRIAALRAISNLKPDTLKDIALDKIQNDTLSVVKEARKYILKHLDNYAIPDLWEIFTTTSRQEVKLSVLLIIEEMPKWRKLFYLLKAGEDKSQRLRELVEKRIENWILSFNRSFIQPSTEEVAQIKELISRSSLNKNLLERLEKNYL